MNTSYIHFVQKHDDPVWGLQALPWVKSGLIRVTRNCLKKAVFEYVGCPAEPVDLDYFKRKYPIVMLADLPNSGSEFHGLRKVSPLPKAGGQASGL